MKHEEEPGTDWSVTAVQTLHSRAPECRRHSDGGTAETQLEVPLSSKNQNCEADLGSCLEGRMSRELEALVPFRSELLESG